MVAANVHPFSEDYYCMRIEICFESKIGNAILRGMKVVIIKIPQGIFKVIWSICQACGLIEEHIADGSNPLQLNHNKKAFRHHTY